MMEESEKEKYRKVLEGMPNLIELHKNLIEKSILIKTAFILKKMKYYLYQQKGGTYSLGDNKTNKYLIHNVTPRELKSYVKVNNINPDDIGEAYLLFDHTSVEIYDKYDKSIESTKKALEDTYQLERSILYTISDFCVTEINKIHNHYTLVDISHKTDKKLVIEGTRKQLIDTIKDDNIDPDNIFRVELLKHTFK